MTSRGRDCCPTVFVLDRRVEQKATLIWAAGSLMRWLPCPCPTRTSWAETSRPHCTRWRWCVGWPSMRWLSVDASGCVATQGQRATAAAFMTWIRTIELVTFVGSTQLPGRACSVSASGCVRFQARVSSSRNCGQDPTVDDAGGVVKCHWQLEVWCDRWSRVIIETTATTATTHKRP